MKRRYGSRRRWGVRRRHSNSTRRPFAWAYLGPNAVSLFTLTSGSNTGDQIVLKSNDIVQPQASVVLDRDSQLEPLLERIIIKLAVIVVSAAIKKLIRIVFGVKIVTVDPISGALPANLTSVNFANAADKRSDWLFVDQRTVNAQGDATLQYTTDHPWELDFKPKRKLGRDQALVFSAYADCLDGGSLDATVKLRVTPQVGLLVPRT